MKEHRDTAETMPPDLIPLSHLVLEGLAESIDQLADRLEDVVVDDIGMRCTTRETARRLIAEKAEAEKQREALWRRQQEQVARKHEEALAGILPGVAAPSGLEDLSASAVMTLGATAERLDAAGERWEEYAAGGITYRPIDPEGTAHE